MASSKKRTINPDPFPKIKEYALKQGTSIYLNRSEENKKIQTSYSWEPKDKILEINTEELEKKDKGKLLDLIRFLFDNNCLFFRKDSRSTFISYEEYSKTNHDKAIIDFFEPIIPTDDFKALKMSLFLRYQSSLGKPIRHLKEDIIEKFGLRGANIANLCSVNYFEEELKPLYNQISPSKFKEYYNALIAERAKALFVSGRHDLKSLEAEFLKTLGKAKRYSIKLFKIYAKGKNNVDLTKQFVAKLDSKEEDAFISQIPFEEFTTRKENEDEEIPTVEYVVNLL